MAGSLILTVEAVDALAAVAKACRLPMAEGVELRNSSAIQSARLQDL